jgi:hypothetical protein
MFDNLLKIQRYDLAKKIHEGWGDANPPNGVGTRGITR